ncbi:4884_t:CDS:2 [Diversispora eburnea]|uniref:4884_t:CDS:1 n=1 Tax=Diversispora eburnea TaxID=1213867 RepID=A0A9N9G1U2_9GLOM|nr:4884_t:CDS:2 [Diversispora eburnea]
MSQIQPLPPGQTQAQIPLIPSTPPGPPGQVVSTTNITNVQPPPPGPVQVSSIPNNAQPPPPGTTSQPGDFQQNSPPPQLRATTPSMIQAKEVKSSSSNTAQNNTQKKPQPPKKSTQPLHLLLLECCKEYITGNLTTKSEEDTKELFNDRRKLHADLQLFCTDNVLTSARDRILNELDEGGKEALKDISPDSEIIKLRFQEAAALNKTLGKIFRSWEQFNKSDVQEGANTGHTEQNRNRGRGNNRGGYWTARGGPRHSPYQNQGQQRRREWVAREDRDYRDRRPDDNYRDRRDDHSRRDFDRRPDFRGPSVPSTVFNRDRIHMGRRDDSFHRNFDDRRRNSHERRLDDNRHPRDHRGPPPLPLNVGPPSKSSPSIYEAPPMPPMPPNVPNPQVQSSPQAGYDYSQYSSDPQQYSATGFQTEYNLQVYPGYFAQYPQESTANGQQYQYPISSASWETQTTPIQSMPIQLASFNWNQPGRHTAIPLPTDFMSGPSSAPRLSMPEPHDVLGVIKGVIIRDAQGNIGLSQYQFSTM